MSNARSAIRLTVRVVWRMFQEYGRAFAGQGGYFAIIVYPHLGPTLGCAIGFSGSVTEPICAICAIARRRAAVHVRSASCATVWAHFTQYPVVCLGDACVQCCQRCLARGYGYLYTLLRKEVSVLMFCCSKIAEAEAAVSADVLRACGMCWTHDYLLPVSDWCACHANKC